MSDYQQGKIYCIRSHQTDDIYIGSTVQSLVKRRSSHKVAYKRYLEGKRKYITSFELCQHDDIYIELIEEYPCDNRVQLEKREGYWMRKMECINKNIAGRSKNEWREDNKEIISKKKKEYYEENKEKFRDQYKEYRETKKENNKKYYEANKEKIRNQHKEYYEANKEKVRERKNKYYEDNKEKDNARSRKYHNANKEKISKQKKKYREENKEKISVRKKKHYETFGKQKVNCECGSVVNRKSLPQHKRSKKHITWASNNEEE